MGTSFKPDLHPYKPQGQFRYWCQTVLPQVYDDSLSYLELLHKVVAYLNDVIANTEVMETNIGLLSVAYGELEDFVNNYFVNLDVTEEIENKLDAMAASGALSALLRPFIPDLVTNWLDDNVTPTGSMVLVDESLSISGAGADAKVTGDIVGSIINDTGVKITITSTYHTNTDTSIPVTAGNTYYIRKMKQTPYWYNVYVPEDAATVCRLKNTVEFVPFTPTVSGFLRVFSLDNVTETMDFEIVSEPDYLRRKALELIKSAYDDNNIMSGYTTMITSDNVATAEFDNDYNNLSDNKTYTIGYSSSTSNNAPYIGYLGNIMTFAYSGGLINGKVQLAISSTGRMLHRICWGISGIWTDWVEVSEKPKIYYVGGTSQYQSLTDLLINLKNDNSEKIIYINPGVYDIFSEYRSANIPTPPDSVSSSDYLTRCVFLPPNTSLIGIGNVVLEWLPDKTEITYGEARTWSPLNVRYACYVENITIRCRNGRYCIHDDSQNAISDQGVTHYYKDVRCIYEHVDDGYGFNNTIGFGFSQKNKIIFDRCNFEMVNGPTNSAFYGHSASSSSGALNIDDSPEIIVKDCIILGGNSNQNVFRLQSLNDELLKIHTLISGTYISGGIYLTLYSSDDKHAFDVTVLKSGNPTQKIDQAAQNPYPIRVYN